MDRLALTAFEILGQAPAYITFLFAVVVLFVALYIYLKKVNITEYTSIGAMQSQQTKLLMDQIEQLSKDLQEARKDLKELFEQNLLLMKRITELEGMLSDHSKTRPAPLEKVDVNLSDEV